MNNVNNQTVTETQTTTVKRGRGRPPGSKNKPKFNADGTPVVKKVKNTVVVENTDPTSV